MEELCRQRKLMNCKELKIVTDPDDMNENQLREALKRCLKREDDSLAFAWGIIDQIGAVMTGSGEQASPTRRITPNAGIVEGNIALQKLAAQLNAAISAGQQREFILQNKVAELNKKLGLS